jgi:hypothetical protein
MTTETPASEETLAGLMRVLRRYADSALCEKLSKDFADMAEQGRAGLVAFEPGSHERHAEAVMIMINQNLSLLLLELRLEIGTARLDARDWLDDATPDDFGTSQ